MSIELGAGITVGAGIGLGVSPSFTLTSPNMKAANGTFLFPATFTLIQPPIQNAIEWC